MSVPIEQSSPGEVVERESGPRILAPITAQIVVSVGPSPAESADRSFVAALRRASLLGELRDVELRDLVVRSNSKTEFARQLDLLELYYSNGDQAQNERRLVADRFFLHHDSSPANAVAIVRELANVAPELGRACIERIGSNDGPLVLRAGESFHAIAEDEPDPDDELALSPFSERQVTVRSIVHAANRILHRVGAPKRFVLLRCDGRREAFCGVDGDDALALCAQGLLEERSSTRLLEFCSFE